MNRGVFVKTVLALTACAVVFFGVMIVNTLDRMQRTQLEILDRLAAAPRAAAPTASAVTSPMADPALPVANREFFDPAAERGGRLIRAISADTQNMNYLINNDSTAADFQQLANSSLATRNYARPELYQPLMAESWEISPDKKSYRIKLRRGILWHDFTDPVNGKQYVRRIVTAADFKFFVDVVKNPDVNCEPLRVYYQDLEAVEVINDYEFVVRWKNVFYGSMAATLGMSPLPRHLYQGDDPVFDGKKFNDDHRRNRILIGCGPYRLLRWEKDMRVIFVRFDDYFGKVLGIEPPLDTIVYELIKHPNTRLQALLAGQLDRLGLTPDQWEKRTASKEFEKDIKRYEYLSMTYSYIGYNLRNPLFADRKVRQALTMLIDREAILREVYYGLGRVINGPFFPESVFYNREIKPWPFDIERAKQQLAEAGWRDTDGDGILDRDGRKFSFTMMQIASHPIQSKMLPMIKETMAKAGIDMKIQVFEWSVFVQRIEQQSFEACALGWTMPLDPDPYQVWHSSQADKSGSSNHIGYKNPEIDRLIEELRVTFEPEKRVELCHRIGRILHEDQPYTFLFVPNALVAQAARYRNVRVFPGGIADEIMWTPASLQKSVPGL